VAYAEARAVCGNGRKRPDICVALRHRRHKSMQSALVSAQFGVPLLRSLTFWLLPEVA